VSHSAGETLEIFSLSVLPAKFSRMYFYSKRGSIALQPCASAQRDDRPGIGSRIGISTK